MDYLYHILILVMIYGIFAISLNLELGFAGLYNFGHIAFFAIGAYTSALLSLGGMPIALAVVLALVASGVAGAILARFTLGLSGDYFGIATLVFAEMIQLLLLNERDITRGPMGLPGIPRPAWMGSGQEGLIGCLAVAVLGTALVFFLVRRISNAPFGRALKVVREDEFVAQALGKNTFVLKAKAMVVGSVLAGFSGVLWAHYITYISPADFTLNETIFVLLCVVVGGKGTNLGPLVGAFAIVFFGEFVRFLPIPAEFSRFVAPLQGMVYGALLIFMMLKRPQGVISESRR
jgi:branched-chain amino acid transport system permease protein